MKNIAKGDAVAFRALSDALGQKIYGLAYRFLSGDRAMAEDIVQDVLLKIWTHAPKWAEGGSVQGWISRITYNACMDVHRVRKNKNDEIPEDFPVAETTTEHILNNEYRRLLLQAIARLPERQQEAILLTYLHENSRSEVASSMKTTEKAVEHLVARGLKSLQQLIPANLNGGTHVFATRSL